MGSTFNFLTSIPIQVPVLKGQERREVTGTALNEQVKNPPPNAGDTGDVSLIPGSRRPLEEEMAARWEIPWTEEPGWLQSMGSQKSRS